MSQPNGVLDSEMPSAAADAPFDHTNGPLLFFVNGCRVDVPAVDPRTTLADFLREHLNLRGTKIGCNEGGCGACTVLLSDRDPFDGKIRHFSVNACLTPLCSVHAKAVTTVEGIAAGYKRMHPVQQRLSLAHGSQCGYCTPGFVMAMYALLRNNPEPTKEDIDECLQGNLCRCTGYRPILEAFYSFAKDSRDAKAKGEEDAKGSGDGDGIIGCCGGRSGEGGCCRRAGVEKGQQRQQKDQSEKKLPCKLSDLSNGDVQPLDPTQELIFPPELATGNWHKQSFAMAKDGFCWLQPTSLAHLLALKNEYREKARLVAGNTEVGVELKFRHIRLDTAISTKQVIELRRHWADDRGLWLGSGLSLNEMKLILRKCLQEMPTQQTLIFRAVLRMLHLFAGQHVRNMATVAGNIATASPISDLNPLWMAARAQVLLESQQQEGTRQLVLNQQFFPAYRKTAIRPEDVLTGLLIPFTGPNQFFRAYKQSQRREDDIAIVSGAFFVEFMLEKEDKNLEKDDKNKDCDGQLPFVLKQLRMAFGGVGPITRQATSSVQGMAGRRWDRGLLELVSQRLAHEFALAEDVPGGMAKYRLALILSFFFKFYTYVSERLDSIDESEVRKRGRTLVELTGGADGQFQSTQLFQAVSAGQSELDPVGRPLMHASGERHATGEAVYTTDIALPSDSLHMAYVCSPVSIGTLISLDFSKALALPGVVGSVDWRDVPGTVMLGHAADSPLFVQDKISFHGQPLAAILALDHETALRGAALVEPNIAKDDGERPIVTIEEAIEANSFLLQNPLRLHSSLALPDAKERNLVDWTRFSRVVQGQIRIGGQEHFYLETQNCVAIPGEGNEMRIMVSSQAVNDVQGDVAVALGVPRHVVSVSVRRIGGGFGGKESCCGLYAAAAAIAAKKFKRPVRFWLERFDDMAVSGNRHPFRFDYRLALEEGNSNKLAAMEVTAFSNCGYSLDLSRGVMERAMAHVDNVYNFGSLDVYGHLCKTNLASNTAFRGFGGPQGMFATETIVKHAAEEFGLDPDQFRELNFYKEGDCTHFGMRLRQCNIARCWSECSQWANYERRKRTVDEWNARNKFVKRGIYTVPTKFGIAFGFKRLNQAGALVHVYTDGSVLISHGGMEMGQGLHTKIIQIASRCLGIDISLIQILETASDKVPNSSPTAASVGSDVNGLAVKDACETILRRLEPLRAELPEGAEWKELISHAYNSRVQLSATGFGKIHCESVNFAEGRGAEYYSYFVYGVGCAEVELDCLSGDHRVHRVDIVMDVGESLNPAVDIGQIEGAFVQGYGLFTMEELKVRPDGTRLTRGPGTYKIPSADDAPRQFHVKLLAGSSNRSGIFSSKAIGEPPLFLGSAAFFALREAIRAYRGENGANGYFRLDSPATPERIRMACADGISKRTFCLPPASSQPWTVEL